MEEEIELNLVGRDEQQKRPEGTHCSEGNVDRVAERRLVGLTC